MRAPILTAFFAAGFLAASALAHDFFILPSKFRPAAGDLFKVDLRVGDTYPGDAYPRNSKHIERFVSVAAADGTEQPIVGREGQEPAGIARLTAPGLYLLAYRSRHSSVVLEGPKFEQYLKEKGLEKIITLRKERSLSDQPAQERYSRCAKSLVTVGESASSSGFDRAVGLRLELIPQTDPAAVKLGDDFRLRLLLDGKPLANALVHGACVEDQANGTSVRTEVDGQCSIKIRRAGVWLFTVVDMGEARPDPALPDAQFESLWSSLTLEFPTPAPAEYAEKPETAKP